VEIGLARKFALEHFWKISQKDNYHFSLGQILWGVGYLRLSLACLNSKSSSGLSVIFLPRDRLC
jgi:hypothetical protein